jgi:hypothetical protein
MRTCNKCKRELELYCFKPKKTTKDGIDNICIECNLKRRREYDKKKGYKRKKEKYHNEPETRKRVLESCKESQKKRKTQIKQYQKEYYQKNKEYLIKEVKKYRIKNRDKLNAWMRKYYKNPSKRIARAMYNRIRIAIFTQLAEKTQKTTNLCGCSWEELVLYLESQFKEGMSWENYGVGQNKWSIDHIKPCNLFDLTNPEEQSECFHYNNLQPLWSSINSSKRDKYIE